MTSAHDVSVRPLSAADRDAYVAAARRSRDLHHPWVTPATDDDAFAADLARYEHDERRRAFLLWAGDDLVGRANLNEIIRGALQSAFCGYFAFAPHAGRGLFRAGLARVLDHAFDELDLHRVEANIRPENVRSLRVAESVGFRREGLSRRYLHLDGEWRDHVRTAVLAEDHPGADALLS